VGPNLPISSSPNHPFPIITLLTDFGTADYFVGAMKGVILSINPFARIVDITHETAAHEVEGAAFNLLAVYRSFPAQTIHVAVVDPGVGSSRRALVVAAGEQFFIGPDNGIFSYVLDREPDARAFHLTNANYFRHPVSNTFHGRDVFAPVAAAVSRGIRPEQLGVEIDDPVRLAPLTTKKRKNGKVEGRIIHIDRFGNCITSFTANDITPDSIQNGAKLTVNGNEIKTFRQFFAEASNSRRPFAIWGSAGFLEIAAPNRSAAKLLKARRGQAVTLSMNK
jgi:S-adenosyl-L-methionine hydrolase (adenosine-forming)